MDFILDTDSKLWLVEVIPSPGLNEFTPEIGERTQRVIGD